MNQTIAVVRDATALAFVALGVLIAIHWLRRRGQNLGYLALAIVLLAAVVALGRAAAFVDGAGNVIGSVALIGFIASGYALFRFRSGFVGVDPRWHVAIASVGAIACVAFLAAEWLSAPRQAEYLVALALVLYWCALVGEAIIRFWTASRALPAVQRARLRSLATGFGGLVAVLVVTVVLPSFSRQPLFQLAVQLLALAIVPLLYISFSPPSWVRRQWRAAEEEAVARATRELLEVAPDRRVIAEQALRWATRLVGARGGLVMDSRGLLTAVDGIDMDTSDRLREQYWPPGRRLVTSKPEAGLGASVITVPVVAPGAPAGQLVLLAGPFSPAFGADELARVEQYAGAVASALDRARLVEQLESANDRLQIADRHKSVFLANMSHELRTPLNSIIGFSELLIDFPEGRYDGATRASFLDQIHQSGIHLLGLINDILDLSKIEAGQMELHLQPIELLDVIDQTMHTIQPLAAKKQIALASDAEAGVTLTADPTKVRQMLLNLVSNAIKFTPNGGRVRVEARAALDGVEIDVIDTGIGIADGDRDRIFTEFQQVDAGTDRQQEGTGLGLTLTKRFAELHGGTIAVASAMGKGSTFTLRLPSAPAALAPIEAKPLPELPADALDGPFVLVVEDNRAAADLLMRQLAEGGYVGRVVTTGKEAVDVARQHKPTAITLDILLPEMDGWDVLAELKRDDATSEIPVVVVSVVDNRELGRALGALDYFVKPIDPKALLAAFDRYTFTTKVKQQDVRILAIDDQPANLEVLRGTLVPLGFKLLTATGGSEGLELARSELPDLVLLDLMMPGVTGFDVVRDLRDDPTTSHVPIMVLTAKDLTSAERQLLHGKVAGILGRDSAASSELVAWLQRILGEKAGA